MRLAQESSRQKQLVGRFQGFDFNCLHSCSIFFCALPFCDTIQLENDYTLRLLAVLATRAEAGGGGGKTFFFSFSSSILAKFAMVSLSHFLYAWDILRKKSSIFVKRPSFTLNC